VARFGSFCPSTRSPISSDWIEDQFITVNFDEDLRGKTFLELVPPAKRMAATDAAGTYANNPIYDEIFGMAQGAEAERVAGSLFGSMQQVSIHEQAISSGSGMWAVPTMSGLTMSGVGMSGVGFCLDATNSASSVLVPMRVDCLRRNRAGCYCHDWRSPN